MLRPQPKSNGKGFKMARQATLSLITRTTPTPTPTPHTTPHTPSPDGEVQRVWEHWKFMLREGRVVARQLSAQRRVVVERACGWYGVGVLELAVEGCAASPFCQGKNRSGVVFDDIAWIFDNEQRIERLAEEGRRARAEYEARQATDNDGRGTAHESPSPEVAARLADMRRFLAAKAR